MSKSNNKKPDILNQQTLAIRSGIERTEMGEHSEALFMTSSFIFDSCHDASEKFSQSSKNPL